MADDIRLMHEYFRKLGLEPEIADIYLALQAYGPQSIMQLARNAGVERTRLYRLIDTLTDNHLIEIVLVHKRNLYKAAPISNIHILLSQKEQELRDLQKGLHELQCGVVSDSTRSPLTHIQFYKGASGLKQMFWNQTKAQGESLSILYENMQNKTNLAFFERWAGRCNEQKLAFRSIVNDNFLATQDIWYAQHSNEKLKYWQGRRISENIFPITHSMVTYDEVIAYYNWKDGEVFGIEIHNQEISDAQHRFFEMLWNQGEEIITNKQ